jgi:hypothetical protein
MTLLDNPIPRDWFDWTNASVGGAGLLFTIAAIWQATGAKRAAQEARQAVYSRNASEDVNRLERLALSLLTAIEIGHFDLALHIARDFIAECPKVREHHRIWLGSEGGKLEVASSHVRAISVGVQNRKPKSGLIEIAQRVVVDMSALAGMLNREIEEKETP